MSLYPGQVVRVGNGTALWSVERMGAMHAVVLSERGRWDHVATDRLAVADLAPEPYCPFRHFERYEHFGWVLETLDLGDSGHVGYTLFDQRRVQLTTWMTHADQRTTLAHEVAHIERGFAHRTSLSAVADDEVEVENTAAMRLITFDALADAARWATTDDELAEELAVTTDLLHQRLRLLTRAERAQLQPMQRAGRSLRRLGTTRATLLR